MRSVTGMIRVTSPLRSAAVAVLLLAVPLVQAADSNPTQERANRFLSLVNASYQALVRVNSNAQWDAVTDVSPVHDAAAEVAGNAYAAFNGNPAIINEARPSC